MRFLVAARFGGRDLARAGLERKRDRDWRDRHEVGGVSRSPLTLTAWSSATCILPRAA
jgi:uncharacterized iron-regulated membrane protein